MCKNNDTPSNRLSQRRFEEILFSTQNEATSLPLKGMENKDRKAEEARAALLRRAVLPEIMLVTDVADALKLTTANAVKAVMRGQCGPFATIGGRVIIRREAFLRWVAQHEV